MPESPQDEDVRRDDVADAVLFDLDGVLVDSRAAIAGCMNHALSALGYAPQAPASLHRFVGPPLAHAFAELTGSLADSEEVAACVAAYRERYASASLVETEVVPGIEDALADLAADHRLAVATSKPAVFAEPILEALGLRGFFALVAGADAAAATEEKTTTLARALEELRPRRAVMVGDRSFDVVAARANGIPAVAVGWGVGSPAELARARAEAIVERPGELAGVVRDLMRLAAC